MPKLDVLIYVAETGEIDSQDVAERFGWTVSGAASALLRLHRSGKLRRYADWDEDGNRFFVYAISDAGLAYIKWAG